MKSPHYAALAILLLLVTLFACTRKPTPEPEGYRVVSYEATGKWVIIRTGTFGGKFLRKRMTVLCDFYKWGDHATVTGPGACDLQVGRFMVPKLTKADDPFESTYIWELSADRLAITDGDGPDRVSQQFVILKNEVLPN